jgi:acetyl esterase/lipase
LEYLAAAVQALKGSCCYEATMPAPKTESWMLPDGTLEVRTTDADPWFAEDRAAQDVQLQAALDAFRAGGCPRPVVFTCAGQDEKTAQVWRQLEPELKQAGKSVANAADQWLPHYVVATDVARRLLLSVFGKAASRLFRTPGWPVGYWSVDICAGGHKVYESRTFKDMGEAKKK